MRQSYHYDGNLFTGKTVFYMDLHWLHTIKQHHYKKVDIWNCVQQDSIDICDCTVFIKAKCVIDGLKISYRATYGIPIWKEYNAYFHFQHGWCYSRNVTEEICECHGTHNRTSITHSHRLRPNHGEMEIHSEFMISVPYHKRHNRTTIAD